MSDLFEGHIPPDSPVLAGIELRHVTAYLGSAGWLRRADFPRPELIVFDGPPDDDGDPIQAVLPAADRTLDFRLRLSDLLRTLAVLEGRPGRDIALEMRSPGVDRILARVLSDIASGGSIPLPFASVLLHGLRDLVAAAACAEQDPRPFFTKATRIGSEHAQGWRFGQTQLGSFVATIECPVVPAVGKPPAPGTPPLPRRVTERIMRGLALLDRAVLDGRPDALLSGYREGLNANMCEALLSFREPGLALQMELSVQWSKRLPAPAGLPPRVLIEGRSFELLDATARTLRAPVEAEEQTFTGEIVRLHRESDEERVVVLRILEGRPRVHARLHLGAEDYRVACDAHRDGRRVQVTGRLERAGHKQWQVLGAREFGLAEGERAGSG